MPNQKGLLKVIRQRPLLIGIGVIVCICIVIITLFSSQSQEQSESAKVASIGESSEHTRQLTILNSIDTTTLSPLQNKIHTLLRQEFAKSPTSYDETVLKYTEGFEESWCADFVSWIMNEADSPNINTETGYWRIPGVLSMMNYYKDIDGYITIDQGYSPQLGDVAFYIGDKTPDGSSGEHIAFVLSYDGKTLVTLGGNEGNGIMRIRSETMATHTEKGLVGYGILE